MSYQHWLASVVVVVAMGSSAAYADPPPPNAVIAVTNVDFGSVPHGTTATSTISVSNAAAPPQDTLHVTSAVIAGGGGWFTFDTNGTAACGGGTLCNLNADVPMMNLPVSVRCNPLAGDPGPHTASVFFTSNSDPLGDSEATLTCDGPPDISILTASIAFGDVPVNPMTPPTAPVMIKNNGNQKLTFTASTGTSPSSSFYALSDCSSITPCDVLPGATRQFTVTFTPTAPTNPNANIDLTLTSNDPDTANVTIPVTGRGVAPQIDPPVSVALGNVDVGKTSTTQPLTITNTGTAPLVISNASFTAGGTEYIAMTGTTGPQMTSVPPMGSATWDILCHPTAPGSRPGTFRIVSNSFMQSMADVSLSCTGDQGALTVSVLPSGTTIDFGPVESGTTATRTFTLTNTGNVPVGNIAAVVSPMNRGYSIDPTGNPVPTMLAAGANVVLTAKFAPQSGADGGAATITFTGGWGTTPTQTTAVLSLDGKRLGYDLSATAIDFGSFRFDATPELTFCITNTGGAPVQIQPPISIAPASGTMTNEFLVVRIRRPATCGGSSTMNVSLPQTLNPGQLLEVTVRADPANRAGMMQATLTVNSNLTANPTRTLTLLGNSTTGAFSLSPGPMINFGPVDVLAGPMSQTITITNTGNALLDLSNFQRTANPRFTFTLPGNQSLSPTQSLAIPVTYQPTFASPAGSEELITLTHAIAGDVDGPTSQTIMIQGRGIDRDVAVDATPMFPDTFRNPGDQAPVRPVRIRNLGEATLKITAVMLDNPAGVFELLDARPVDIPKGASQEFLVRFAPKIAARATAKLLLMHDDRKKPLVSVDLVGNGIDRSVRFTPDAIRIGYTGVGVPVTIEDALVVTSMDASHAFQIRAIEVEDGTPFTIEGLTPDLDLPALSQRTFSVTFTPDAPGPFTTKAHLYLDMDPEAQHEVTIQGVAVFVDAHGGGGCAAGGTTGAGGSAVIALAALLGLVPRRRRRRSTRALAGATATATATALALALAPATASADDIVLSVFDPVPATTSNGFQLQSPDVGASGDWALSAVVSYASNPLVLSGSADGSTVNDYAVISRSTAMNLGGAVAFLGRFEAGARLPLYMQDGQPAGDPLQEFTAEPADGTARGDLALHAKARLVRKRLEGDGALLAGVGAQLTLPTATRDRFTGVEDPSGRVLLLGALQPGAFEKRITVTANLGAVIRAPATYANLEQKSGVAWGLGVDVRALDPLWLAVEVYGDTVPSGRTDEMTHTSVLSPIEWLAGLRWKPEHRIIVGLAAGRGLTNAVGTPGFRGVLSLTITPGAPEVQPIHPAKPDGDADGDGVRDSADRCPSEPEDKDAFDDTDGCPDKDNDQDGLADAEDKCPIDAEDKDGFEDTDGCPDKDNDRDGIPDARDKCPMQPEDKDGFADTDGCPEDDNDRDGILDGQDRCPTQPETINGNQDDDGCADKGDSLVVLSPDRLELLDAIQFTAGQKIAKASQGLLAQVGATMRARTEIARLRITVHVQPTSNDEQDQELSDKRAAAVRDWLVQWGIAPQRLEVRGFGGTKPVVPPDRKDAAALNQRVELIILERK